MKTTLPSAATAPSAFPRSSANAGLASSHGEIATWAEALWRQKGCPRGCDDEIWLEAEQQLLRQQRLERDERDENALADSRFGFGRKSDDRMGELDERFPGPTRRETTSL